MLHQQKSNYFEVSTQTHMKNKTQETSVHICYSYYPIVEAGHGVWFHGDAS